MGGITNPSEEYFKDGVWGYDGSVWRKLPLVFGYTDNIIVLIADYDADAGQNDLTYGPVPAGEIRILNYVSYRNENTAGQPVTLYCVQGIYWVVLSLTPIVVAGTWYFWSGSIILKEGDKFVCRFRNCAAHDNIYLDVIGYKMSVA